MAAKGLNVFVNIGARVLPSLGTSASNVERRIGQMGKKLRLAAAETKLAMSELNAATGGLAGLAAAGGLVFGMKAAIGAGADYDHELQGLRNAGRSSQDVAKAIAAANKTILDLPTSTLAGNLAMINETTSAFGDYSHAIENVGRNQKLAFMLNNVGGEGHGGDTTHQIGSLIRMLEMRGAANNPERYGKETDEAYKAIQFTKGRVNGEDFFQFGGKANPLIKTLSDRYLYKIAPSLMTEYGSDVAGTMHSALANTILGKVGMGGKTYAENFANLGLLDPKLARRSKDGSVKGWSPGAIKGTNVFMSDPLRWAEEFLIPALKAKGVNTDDKMAMQVEISKLVGKNTAARLLGSLTDSNDRKRLHKDEGFTNQVTPMDKAVFETLAKDPKAGLAAFKMSVTNLMAALSGPVIIPAARGLVALAEGINKMAVVFQEHPGLSRAVSGLVAGLAGLATLNIGSKLLGFLLPMKTLGSIFTKATPIILRSIARLGPMMLDGLMALGPAILEGVVGAFALLSNPVGWAFLATIAIAGAVALAWHFRGALSEAWSTVTEWFASAFESVKTTIMSIDWAGVGMAIADALTFGLASKLPHLLDAVRSALSKSAAEANYGETAGGLAGSAIGAAAGQATGTPLAGKRAGGGSVRGGGLYQINERGQELFMPGRSGTIISARATAALIAAMSGGLPAAAAPAAPFSPTIVIQGAQDPAATAAAVESVLRRMAREQRGALND